MKKVVFGSALLIGGILLTTLSMLKIDNGISGLILAFPYIGIVLTIIGGALGAVGLREDATKDNKKE